MAMLLQRTGAAAGVSQPRQAAPRCQTRVAAVQGSQASSKPDEIYLGFPKGDYDRTPGRKGRTIRDDPTKYPNKEDMGFFLGAVGGWAGGEAGLWELRDQVLAEQAKGGSKKTGTQLAPSSPIRQPQKNKWGARTTTSAKDPIYVGFAKDEIELRKSGAQGRVIYDEAYKYPNKEDMGWFMGAVGGFAGGEAVLREFAESGELKLRKPGEPSTSRQTSPLTLAFLVIFAAAGGGLLLTTALDLGEVSQQVAGQ